MSDHTPLTQYIGSVVSLVIQKRLTTSAAVRDKVLGDVKAAAADVLALAGSAAAETAVSWVEGALRGAVGEVVGVATEWLRKPAGAKSDAKKEAARAFMDFGKR